MKDGSGFAVEAAHDVELGAVRTSFSLSDLPNVPLKGEAVCVVPKSALLSQRTASLSRSFPLSLEARPSDVILHLTLCLLHELRLGHDSEFYEWLQILPRSTIMLPTFWGDEELAGEDGKEALKWLTATQGERELRRKDEEGLSLVRPHLSFMPPLIQPCRRTCVA